MTEIRDKIARKLAETLNETSYVWADSAYELAIDGDVDTGVLADAILPLIREAQAEAHRGGYEDAICWVYPTADAEVEILEQFMASYETPAAYRVGEGQSNG